MIIDQIIYTPADVEAESYPIISRKASHGAVTAEMAEAKEGDVVNLNITPDAGYELTELRVINGVYYTMQKTLSLETLNDQKTSLTFIMPDDQVVLQPVFGKSTTPNAIKLIDAEGEQTKTIYGMGGEQRTSLQKGVNIIRTADGKIKKVMVR